MEAHFPHPGCCRKSQEEVPSLLSWRPIPLLRMRRLQLIMKRRSSVLLLPIQKNPERFQLSKQTRVKPISNNQCIYLRKHHIVLTGQKVHNQTSNRCLSGWDTIPLLNTKTKAGSKGCYRKKCPQSTFCQHRLAPSPSSSSSSRLPPPLLR